MDEMAAWKLSKDSAEVERGNAPVVIKTEASEYGLKNEVAEKLRNEDGQKDVQFNQRQT